jgi:hypothetical protein
MFDGKQAELFLIDRFEKVYFFKEGSWRLEEGSHV